MAAGGPREAILTLVQRPCMQGGMLPAAPSFEPIGAGSERLESPWLGTVGSAEGLEAMTTDLFHENWRHEQRADGLYVIIEEIGGLGALGPFPDANAARIGFARYFLGLDRTPPSAPVLPKTGDEVVPGRQTRESRLDKTLPELPDVPGDGTC